MSDGIPRGIEVITTEFLRENHIDDMVNSFAAVCELYTALLDVNGQALLEPTGPAPYLGEFYEIVLDPKYHQDYINIVSGIAASGQSLFSDVDDGNPDSHLAAAPVFVDGVFFATWILYAENKSQGQKLFKAFDHLDRMANVLSNILTKLSRETLVSDEGEEVKSQLKFEHDSKEIMTDILEAIAGGDKSAYKGLYEKVGRLMDVDHIVYYAVDDDRPGYMKLVEYWSKKGKSQESEGEFVWDRDHYDPVLQEQIKNNGLIIDKENMTNRMRVEVFEGHVKAIMVYPIFTSGVYHGRLIFIENTKERIWTKDEKAFAKELAYIMSRNLSNDHRVISNVKVARVVIDILEHLPVYAFVRNRNSGEVLYANKSLKEKLGTDIVGKESYSIIPDVKDEYAGLAGSGAPKLSKNTRYKRYINRLEGIYDVAEHLIKWKDGQKVSVIIMRPE